MKICEKPDFETRVWNSITKPDYKSIKLTESSEIFFQSEKRNYSNFNLFYMLYVSLLNYPTQREAISLCKSTYKKKIQKFCTVSILFPTISGTLPTINGTLSTIKGTLLTIDESLPTINRTLLFLYPPPTIN